MERVLSQLPVRRMIRRTIRRTSYRRTVWYSALPDVSIVVPVLNEAANILPLVRRVSSALADYHVELLFVDDSKNDETVDRVALAQKLYRSRHFSVNVYHREGEQNWGGLSGAVTDGLARALSEKVIVMDGDLQHPPETIPSMLEASKTSEIVIASRYCKGGSASGLSGGFRHLVSSGSTLLAKVFFPRRLRKVSDPMTGFFLIHRPTIDRTRLRPKGFKILLEILATHPELSVAEVPFDFAERVAGTSNGSLKQGLEFLSQLVLLRLAQQVRYFNALPKFVQFGAIGGSVFAFGMTLLYVLVELFSVPPLLANGAQLVVTFGLNYLLNRKITWRERSVSRLAAHKFLLSRTATTMLNYGLFAWLISLQFSVNLFGQSAVFSIGYIGANIITLLAITVVNYYVSDRWAFAEADPQSEQTKKFTISTSAYLVLIAALFVASGFVFGIAAAMTTFLVLSAIGLFLQACLESWRMMYAYRTPESADRLKFPKMRKPKERFVIIVPARHESAVIATTLRQLAKQTHPNVDIISVMCDDDHETLQAAYEVAATEPKLSIIQYPLSPTDKPSKPKQLNYVFRQIEGRGYTVVGVVDAEDTVHPKLLRHIDTAFRDREVGIVQGGVQLMNHDSSWFSLHNVLEYYRWFNSAMMFQADRKFIPLGGNTIFIREELLRAAGGWPETLTEDCSLGVILSTKFQAKTAVYYEPRLATREETPDTLTALFKQRVRWNQGFYHEWRKGVWRNLPQLRQRMLASYVLLSPVVLAAVSVFLPVSLISAAFLHAPTGLAMLMYLPVVPLMLLLFLNAIFLHDFGRDFERKITIRQYSVLFATHFVYQVVLNLAALWSVVRELRGEQSWYKTAHSGQHREPAPVLAVAKASVDSGSAH